MAKERRRPNKPIAIIEVKLENMEESKATDLTNKPSPGSGKELFQDVPEFTSIILGKESNTEPVGIEEKRFYSPLVQSIANQENVNS